MSTFILLFWCSLRPCVKVLPVCTVTCVATEMHKNEPKPHGSPLSKQNCHVPHVFASNCHDLQPINWARFPPHYYCSILEGRLALFYAQNYASIMYAGLTVGETLVRPTCMHDRKKQPLIFPPPSLKHVVGPVFHLSQYPTSEGEQQVVRLSAPILTSSSLPPPSKTCSWPSFSSKSVYCWRRRTTSGPVVSFDPDQLSYHF